MTLGDDVKKVKEAMTSPPKKPVRFDSDPYAHIERQIDRLEELADDQHLCGVDAGRSGQCHAAWNMEEAANTMRQMLDEITRLQSLLDAEMDSNHRLAARELELQAENERLQSELAAYIQDGGERVNQVVAECIRIGALRALRENEKLQARIEKLERGLKHIRDNCADEELGAYAQWASGIAKQALAEQEDGG